MLIRFRSIPTDTPGGCSCCSIYTEQLQPSCSPDQLHDLAAHDCAPGWTWRLRVAMRPIFGGVGNARDDLLSSSSLSCVRGSSPALGLLGIEGGLDCNASEGLQHPLMHRLQSDACIYALRITHCHDDAVMICLGHTLFRCIRPLSWKHHCTWMLLRRRSCSPDNPSSSVPSAAGRQSMEMLHSCVPPL